MTWNAAPWNLTEVGVLNENLQAGNWYIMEATSITQLSRVKGWLHYKVGSNT